MTKIVFFGTPAFSLPTLSMLYENYQVVAVVCQPDRARDRKGNFIFSPVKKYALEKNIPVMQFEKIRRDGVDSLKSLGADLFVTCAYGQILSREILDLPLKGVINVHGSILPEYRGSSPLQWTLIDGKIETGVTIMKTDVGMDTGDILSVKKFNIPDDMYIDELFEKASIVGAELLKDTLFEYLRGNITPIKQDEALATKCVMIKKEDALIDWNKDNVSIRNKVRGIGFGYTFFNGENLKIYKLDLSDRIGVPGEIEVNGKSLVVFCGQGAVALENVQLPNKKRLDVKEFLNGTKIKSGDKFTIE